MAFGDAIGYQVNEHFAIELSYLDPRTTAYSASGVVTDGLFLYDTRVWAEASAKGSVFSRPGILPVYQGLHAYGRPPPGGGSRAPRIHCVRIAPAVYTFACAFLLRSPRVGAEAAVLGNCGALKMTELSRQDVADVLRVGRAALECNSTAELRTKVASTLAIVFDSDSCGFMLPGHSPGEINLSGGVISGDPNHEFWMEKYNRCFAHKDQISARLRELAPKVATLDQLVDFEDFLKSEYYREFLLPQSIHYMMFIELRTGNQLIGHIGLHRARHRGDFSPLEVAKAEELAPYLTSALQKTLYLERIAERESIISCMARILPYDEFLVLNADLELIHASEKAAVILHGIYPEVEPSEESMLSLPEDVLQCCRQLSVASWGSHSTRTLRKSIVPATASTGQANLVVHRLNDEHGRWFYVICLETGPSPASASSESVPRRLQSYGLTSRELEVAQLIYRGFKRAKIAEQLYISKHTVDTHVASIYQKLAVENSTGLVHLLMDLSR